MSEKVVELCQEMVRRKSDSGHEGEVAAYMKEFFEREGFDEVTVDEFGNVIARLAGNRPGKTIVVDGHMDTVPADNADEWMFPPCSGQIHEGKIYGRGTTDMKGPLAATICAALEYKEETGGNFPGEIYICCTVHEECFEGVASHGVTARIKPDYVIIAEPSSLVLKIGQKGRAEIQVETFGKAAHSSNPDAGVNAVYKMMKLIGAFREMSLPEDRYLGPAVLELTDIVSAPYPGASVVPEYCKATYDRRVISGETRESVLAPMQEIVDRLCAEDPELNVKLSYSVGHDCCYTGKKIEAERFFPAWSREESEPDVQAVLARLKEDGLETTPSRYYFCTNGSHYGGELGMKVLGYGPSFEPLCHVLNEHIEIDQLLKGVRGYRCIYKGLLEDI